MVHALQARRSMRRSSAAFVLVQCQLQVALGIAVWAGRSLRGPLKVRCRGFKARLGSPPRRLVQAGAARHAALAGAGRLLVDCEVSRCGHGIFRETPEGVFAASHALPASDTKVFDAGQVPGDDRGLRPAGFVHNLPPMASASNPCAKHAPSSVGCWCGLLCPLGVAVAAPVVNPAGIDVDLHVPQATSNSWRPNRSCDNADGAPLGHTDSRAGLRNVPARWCRTAE